MNQCIVCVTVLFNVMICDYLCYIYKLYYHFINYQGYICVCMCMCMCVCVCVCIYMYIYIYIYIRMYVYVCMYIYVCVCMCIYMSINSYTIFYYT